MSNSNSPSKSTPKTINFSMPSLAKCTLKNHSSYLSPYRREGMCIKHELINGRHVIHNYGHGSSGINLAYGSAYIAVKALMIKVDLNKPLEAAVVGDGINGLMTAIELLKRGFRVTVYSGQRDAKKLSVSSPKETRASSMGYSLWVPDGYDYSEDLLKHELVSKLSYDYLSECIKTKKYRSISHTAVVEIGKSIDEIKEVISEFVFDTFREVLVSYERGQQEEAVQFRTLLVDNNLYCEELRTEAVLRGAKFAEVPKVTSLDQLMDAVPCNVIVNCMGVGAKAVFDDEQIQPREEVSVELDCSSADRPLQDSSNQNWILRLHLDDQQKSSYQLMRANNSLLIYLPCKENAEEKVQGFIERHLLKLDSHFSVRQNQNPRL